MSHAYDKLRQSVLERLSQHIRLPIEMIRVLEESCWNASATALSDRQSMFKQYCCNAIANLSEDEAFTNGNAYLIKAVRSGVVDVNQIPTMQSYQLDPYRYKIESSIQVTTPVQSSSAFECPECKARKCTHYELQTRSADESTTIFITCLVCKNKWTE